MKSTTIKTAVLLGALQRLKPVFANVSSLPVLSSVLIASASGGLRLSATNLDTEMTVDVAAEEAGDFGPLCAPGAKLLAACAKIQGEELELRLEKRALVVTSGAWWLKLFTLGSEEFPAASVVEAEGFEVSGEALGVALRAALRSVSEDETRYVLNGVLFCDEGGELKLVSTDGRRLFQATTSADVPQELLAIVPSLACKRLSEMCEGAELAELRFGESMMEARAGDWTLRTKLIEGSFPNYAQVIPAHGAHRITVGREGLLEALPFVDIFAAGKSPSVKLVSAGKELRVQTSLPDVGEAEVTLEAKVKGGALSVAYNAHFMRDVLASFSGTEVTLDMADGTSPTLIEEEGALAVLMPMRVS